MVEHHHQGLHIDKREHEMTYYEKRILALNSLLLDKGIITTEELQAHLREMDSQTPAIGARVIARAWLQPDFKQRLLTDGNAAMDEMKIQLRRIQKLQVVENTDSVHYVTVCTLCSCYPTPLLGPTPDWYKDEIYRTWMAEEPRAALKDMGFIVADDVETRVVDSTAECRYLVLPKRPPNTEGMSEEELASLVTRDSMIGVGEPLTPTVAS